MPAIREWKQKEVWLERLFFAGLSLYYATYFLNMLHTGAWNDANNEGFRLIRYMAYGLFLLVILLNFPKDKKLWIGLGIVTALLIPCSMAIEDKTYFYVLLIFLAGYCSTSSRKILLWLAIWQFIMLLVVPYLAQAGFISTKHQKRQDRWRFFLGFYWTTFPSMLMAHFVLIIVFLKGDKITAMEMAFLELGNLLFYVLTDSRMAFYLSSLTMLLLVLHRTLKPSWKKRLSKTAWATLALPAVCCAVSIWLQAVYDSKNMVMRAMSIFMSDRLYLGHQALLNYPVTPFGQKITWVGAIGQESGLKYNYVDNSYLQILLSNGWVFLALILAMYTFLLYRSVKRKRFYEILVLCMAVLLGLTEPRLWNLAFNPLPWLMIDAVKGEKEEKHEEG